MCPWPALLTLFRSCQQFWLWLRARLAKFLSQRACPTVQSSPKNGLSLCCARQRMYRVYPRHLGLQEVFPRFVKSSSLRLSSWMQDLTRNNLVQSLTCSWSSFTRASNSIWSAAFRTTKSSSTYWCTSRIARGLSLTSSRRCSSLVWRSVRRTNAAILKTWLTRRTLTTKEFSGARSRWETRPIARTSLFSRC